MKKHLLSTLFLFLMILSPLFVPRTLHAAPGDFLFKWGANQQFSGTGGVAVDANGKVYVTDANGVQAFDSSGIRIAKWGSYGSGDGQFSYPTGLAVDGTGTVYVADTGNLRIQAFSSSGGFLRKWTHPDWEIHAPAWVATDGSGKVYVGEYEGYVEGSGWEGGVVKVFDSNGNFLRQLTTRGQGSDQILGPGGVATDSAGNVYVVDFLNYRIQVYDSTGKFLRTVVNDENMLFSYGLAVDQSGNIYATLGGGDYIYKVVVFNSAGILVRELDYDDELPDMQHYWQPRSVAVDARGITYTLDTFNDGVRAFDANGNLLSQWWTYGTGPGQLSRPTGIALDASGNVYETDADDPDASIVDDRVRVFTATGVPVRKWTSNFCETSGIAVNGSSVYVLDYSDPSGWRPCTPSVVAKVFDSSGNFVGQWGAPEDGGGDLSSSNLFSIAVDKSGNFLVSDDLYSRIRVYDSTGKFVKNFGSAGSGDGQFNYPGGIAVDANGYIFVADTGNSRVQVFDSSYRFVRKFGSEGTANGLLSAPTGIAIDGSGHVLVADTGNSRVQVFENSGAFLAKWGSAGDENGLFREPKGIAVNSSGGNVYVADTGNNRIQVFQGFATGYSISGTVRQGSATGPVLSGATVAIAGKSATTSSTGAFSIAAIPAGSYTLTISKAGFVPQSVSNYVVNSNKTGLVYYLTPAYSVSGTVRQGSSTGAVLAGATVAIAGKSATTTSTGTFSITGIPAGTYTVTISKTGFVTKTVSVVVNSNLSGLAYYLAPAYSVSGTVRQGSSTGAVLAGAVVAIAGKSATTTSTGTFSITGIPAGTYTVTISKTGFVTKSVTGLIVSSNKTGLVYYLTPAYSMSGTVRQGNATGPLLAGVTVSIAGKIATTGSTGAFSITGIPAGTYTLTLSKAGYATKTVTGYVVNANKSGLVFYLAPAYTISGTVRQGSATGPVLAGATVAVAGKSTVTGATGTFSIAGIAAGSYTLTISRTGYVTKTVSGYVINGNKSGLVFYLAR